MIARSRLLVGCAVLIAGPPALALHAVDVLKEPLAQAQAPVSAVTLSSLEIDLPDTPEATALELDDSKSEGHADHATDDPEDPDPE